MKKTISNKVNSFLFFLILIPFCSYGYDEQWTLYLGEATYDVTFQYNDRTGMLINVYINGALVSDGGDRFQNIITFTNVITGAKESGMDVMSLRFRKNMVLPNMKGDETTVFENGSIKLENYSKLDDKITFQIVDKAGNKITVTVENKRISKLETIKGKYDFRFEKDDFGKDDPDRGEGGATVHVNHFFAGRFGDAFSFYDFKKIMFLKYDPSAVFF